MQLSDQLDAITQVLSASFHFLNHQIRVDNWTVKTASSFLDRNDLGLMP
jgi:hypothetical protein